MNPASRRYPWRSSLCAGCIALAAWTGVLAPVRSVADQPAPPAARSQGLAIAPLDQLTGAIRGAIEQRQIPGAVLWVQQGTNHHAAAQGSRTVRPAPEPLQVDTIFDAASLTKVMATAPALMILHEEKRLDFDAPVSRYLPEFKLPLTVRHLATHTSGLRPGLSPRPTNQADALAMAFREKTTNTPGATFIYSDINYILLGELVHRISGQPLHEFAQSRIYGPLGMKDTRYLPPAEWRGRIAPTEREGTNDLCGIVHDPTARRMGGVAGHAGVFTTAPDLARYCRMILNGGELDGRRILSPESVRVMTRVQSPESLKARRGIGWDIDTGYSGPRGERYPAGTSFGHTGFTGTSVWLDPGSDSFVILFTSRLHPDGRGDVLKLRKLAGTLAAESVGLPAPPPAPVPAPAP